MNPLKKIAVFDFCETLVPFQSADRFVEFVYNSHKSYHALFWHYLFEALNRLKILKFINRYRPNLSFGKRIMTKQLKGVPEKEMNLLAESYFKLKIQPSVIKNVLNELTKRNEDGFDVYIVSGGYDVYLKFFASEYGIPYDHVISTKLEKRNGVYTGCFDGIDCMRNNKVMLMNEVINRDLCYVVAYSDSFSDFPLFQWADESFVVSKGKEVFWANSLNNLNKIIKWEK